MAMYKTPKADRAVAMRQVGGAGDQGGAVGGLDRVEQGPTCRPSRRCRARRR